MSDDRKPYIALDAANLPKGMRYEPEHNRIVVVTYDERGSFRIHGPEPKDKP